MGMAEIAAFAWMFSCFFVPFVDNCFLGSITLWYFPFAPLQALYFGQHIFR